MSNKRKVLAVRNGKNSNNFSDDTSQRSFSTAERKIIAIFEAAQKTESLHTKYIKELHLVYLSMHHSDFMKIFLYGLKTWLTFDLDNTYANAGLKFMAKYATTQALDINDQENETENSETEIQSVFHECFEFLLKHTSSKNVIRLRICQFVNMLLDSMGRNAELDEDICIQIQEYMTGSLKDSNNSVRVEGVRALQRLQDPTDTECPVIQMYIYHLQTDPVAKVRQAVLTVLCRTKCTLPHIIERLWDIDESVRRHCIIQMSAYNVKLYTIQQRIDFLAQGLYDRSTSVRQAVIDVMLPNWFECYDKSFLKLLSALNLACTEDEFKQFLELGHEILTFLLKRINLDDLINELPICHTFDKHGVANVIPFEKLTIENVVFWKSLIKLAQTNESIEDRMEDIICDLSGFCRYVENCYAQFAAENDTENRNYYEEILSMLLEIIKLLDFDEEVGRQNLQRMISNILSHGLHSAKCIAKLVECAELVLPEENERMLIMYTIVNDQIKKIDQPIDVTASEFIAIIQSIEDPETMVKVSQGKMALLDLMDEECAALESQNYNKSEEIAKQLREAKDEFLNLLLTHTTKTDDKFGMEYIAKLRNKESAKDQVLQCLQICFYTVCSKKVTSLAQCMCRLYKEFICRKTGSTNIAIRDWSLKCCAAFGMLYRQIAISVYEIMCLQLYEHKSAIVWCTAISSLCELFAYYGIRYFEINGLVEKDDENESIGSADARERNIIDLLLHIFDNCSLQTIRLTITKGFCMLILRGQYSITMVSKLLIEYFNSEPDAEINQVLGIFFKKLLQRCKQNCLQEALLETIFQISESAVGTYAFDIDAVIKFVINATTPSNRMAVNNVHNALANSFLNTMTDKSDDCELIKVLAKNLINLQIGDNDEMKAQLRIGVNNVLKNSDTQDGPTKKYLNTFKTFIDSEQTLSQVVKQVDDSNNKTVSDSCPSEDTSMSATINISTGSQNNCDQMTRPKRGKNRNIVNVVDVETASPLPKKRSHRK